MTTRLKFGEQRIERERIILRRGECVARFTDRLSKLVPALP